MLTDCHNIRLALSFAENNTKTYNDKIKVADALKSLDNIEKLNENENIIEVPLFQVEFEENWISFQLTAEQMADGFHVGKAKIDLSGIRSINRGKADE